MFAVKMNHHVSGACTVKIVRHVSEAYTVKIVRHVSGAYMVKIVRHVSGVDTVEMRTPTLHDQCLNTLKKRSRFLYCTDTYRTFRSISVCVQTLFQSVAEPSC
jgi:hypothetical protein